MAIRSDSTPYSDLAKLRPASAHSANAVSIDQPVAGFFRHKLNGRGVAGGVRIWFGPPLDPVTGEVLDRSWRWQALFNGDAVDFDEVWPRCTGEPITAEDYQRYIARQAWAQEKAPNSAYADPRRRHDPLSTKSPLPF